MTNSTSEHEQPTLHSEKLEPAAPKCRFCATVLVLSRELAEYLFCPNDDCDVARMLVHRAQEGKPRAPVVAPQETRCDVSATGQHRLVETYCKDCGQVFTPPAAPSPASSPIARLCGFCGKTEYDVSTLIQAAVGYICNECVAVCAQIIERNVASSPSSPVPPEQTPLCPVHKRLEDADALECEIGNDCIACSLNERRELLGLIAEFAAEGNTEDSVTVLSRIAEFYKTHASDGRVIVSYPAATSTPVEHLRSAPDGQMPELVKCEVMDCNEPQRCFHYCQEHHRAICLSTPSPSARSAAEEIADRWSTGEIPETAKVHSLERNQLSALAEHVINKHFCSPGGDEDGESLTVKDTKDFAYAKWLREVPDWLDSNRESDGSILLSSKVANQTLEILRAALHF